MLRSRRLVAVGVALIACESWAVSGESESQTLPPPPPGTTHFSDYKPEHPYKPTKEEGVFERSVFTASSGKGYEVEVRDFLVSPANPNAHVPLPGTALLEVRAGAGSAAVSGGLPFDLHPGTVFTVNLEERLLITALDEPLALRSWIIKPGESR